MDKQLANYFFEETSKAFSFAVNEHSFAVPQLEVDKQINFAFVTFMGKNLAIECSLDGREGDIACIIARVTNGKKATCYDAIDEYDKNGERVREYLRSLLARHGVRESVSMRISGLAPRERIKVSLAGYAQMLRKHGQEILNDSRSALM